LNVLTNMHDIAYLTYRCYEYNDKGKFISEYVNISGFTVSAGAQACAGRH